MLFSWTKIYWHTIWWFEKIILLISFKMDYWWTARLLLMCTLTNLLYTLIYWCTLIHWCILTNLLCTLNNLSWTLTNLLIYTNLLCTLIHWCSLTNESFAFLQSLSDLARLNDGRVICPRTKEIFHIDEAEKVFVM